MKKRNIEVEGGEILLTSKEGHYAVIPAKHRQEVMDMVKEGCDDCINDYIQTLPKDSDYADDGSLLPNWNKVKATLNPKNWGVLDYSDKGDFNTAFAAARKAGEKEFMWNNTRFPTTMKNLPGERIKERDDFKGNFLSYTASGGKRADAYGDNAMGDAYRYYGGLPLKSNELGISKYKPTSSKDTNTRYVSIHNEQFLSDILKYANIAFNDEKREEFNKNAYDNMSKVRNIPSEDYDKVVPFKTIKEGTTYTFPTGTRTSGDKNSSRALGNMFISKGADDRGEYYSYYDVFDKNTGKVTDETGHGWATSPYEIYDRVYIKDYGDGQKKKMYYTDKELSELDIDKKDFDTLALQRELSNRGYKLPKSTKEDGTLDGILGDETKNALLDYQTKNKITYIQKHQKGKKLQKKVGNLIPKDKKKITFKYKPYTAVQDNTYVEPKVILPLEKKKEKQFIPRERPVLRADTRTEQQRKIAQEYTESVLNPSTRTLIGEAFQKPLRWLADPVKGVGDIVSAIAPNSSLAKVLPNTNEDVFEYRRKQLNPHTSGKEKINNTINEAIPLMNWALLNALPMEAAAGSMIKSGKNLIKPEVGKSTPSLIKKGYKEIPKENSNPYGYMRRIFNPPVDELGQKLKFSVPSKIKNSETYRVMTTADTEHLLSTGKFKTSLPIEQDVKFMEGLKTTNPERYKAIKYAENSRNYTRVTPDKNYAEMHYFDDLINPSDKGNIITLKPLKNRIAPSTEVGGYNELFAKDLTIDDVLHIKDRSGKVIYQSPNSKNSFKSEIDWGKWNEEIPKNSKLMEEYNAIEKASKANGTWMKNPDGTGFPGTPEQFVQQNSSNFKNAFGNTKVLVNGRPQIMTHNSPDTFSEFSLNKVNNGRLSGDGVYTFEEGPLWKGMPEHIKKALRYPAKIDQIKYGKNEYHLYGNSTNPKIGKGQFDDITKDIVIDSPTSTRVIDDINGKIIHVFPNTNQLKSAIGNNGMFDMTNPNIYKGLIPPALMTGSLKPKKNKDEKRKRSLVETLPVMEDYAEGGSLIPRNQVTQKKGRTIIFTEEPASTSAYDMVSYGLTRKEDGSVLDKDLATLAEERWKNEWRGIDNISEVQRAKKIAHIKIQDYVMDSNFQQKDIEYQNKKSAIDAKIKDVYKKKGYPIITDKTFKTEAERGAEYYKRNNIPYEIVSFYGDKQKIVDSLSGDDISDIVLMGHSGKNIAGIPLTEWNEIIKNVKYDRCILGSCFGDLLVHDLKDVKNLHHTDGIQWEGVNPKANKSEDFYFPKGYQIKNKTK